MKTLIIGGGFSGIEAARELSKEQSPDNKICMIDRNKYTTLLPNLPEVAGDRLKGKHISEDIVKQIPDSIEFINDEVSEINLDEKKVRTKRGEYDYDYLILASGSQTNFYGFNENLDRVHVLDDLESAKDIRYEFEEYLRHTNHPTVVVSGAGFTGIELACNLYDFSKRRGKNLKVILVELAKRVLPMLSEKSTEHVMSKLHKLGFHIYTDTRVSAFDGRDITLTNNEVIKNAFFCWCSGVTPSVSPVGEYEKLPDGRIVVSEFLSIPKYPEVYAVGDSAAMKDKDGKYLRRSVHYAETSGKHAAENINAVLKNKAQQPYNPTDLGWIIPIYISSIGSVGGVVIKGRKGIFLHYLLSGFNNYNIRNFFSELKAAFVYTFARP